jgi:hypothetical protein
MLLTFHTYFSSKLQLPILLLCFVSWSTAYRNFKQTLIFLLNLIQPKLLKTSLLGFSRIFLFNFVVT